MFITLVAAVTLVAPPAPCGAPELPADTTLVALYQGGQDFGTFLENARRRRAAWQGNHGQATVPADLLERARAIAGSWQILAVAVDGCSDSVETLPYIARLVEDVESLDMRIVDSSVGRAIMEAHRTADGRAATPTFVLMDAQGNEAGCFIERPQALVAWLEENGEGMGNQEFYQAKMGWYAEDAGTSTVRQLVEILEGAAAGRPVCR